MKHIVLRVFLAVLFLVVVFGGAFVLLRKETFDNWTPSAEDVVVHDVSPVQHEPDFTRISSGNPVIVRGADITLRDGESLPRHTGMDVTSEEASPRLRSLVAGRVVYAQECAHAWCEGMGNAVVVERADGLQVLYAHLASFLVQNRQEVAEGQDIGVMGETGKATGVHVHVEVCRASCEIREAENFIDPLEFLKNF